jgi:hypothetical protein
MIVMIVCYVLLKTKLNNNLYVSFIIYFHMLYVLMNLKNLDIALAAKISNPIFPKLLAVNLQFHSLCHSELVVYFILNFS